MGGTPLTEEEKKKMNEAFERRLKDMGLVPDPAKEVDEKLNEEENEKAVAEYWKDLMRWFDVAERKGE